jgi:hypothetical protein
MGLAEASEPGRISADAEVGGWMEVAMATVFVAAEDYCWTGSRRDVVKETVDTRKFVGSDAKVPAKQSG